MRFVFGMFAIAALTVPAFADEPPKVPTGYQVPGPAALIYDAQRGYIPIAKPESTKDAKTFWHFQDRDARQQTGGL